MYNARIYKGEIEVNGYSNDGVGYAINALFNRCIDIGVTILKQDVIIVYEDNKEIIKGNANVLHKLRCGWFDKTIKWCN